MTTVKGTLNVDQAVTLDDTFTVASGKLSQLGGSVTVQQSLDTVLANALDIASTTANAVNVSKAGVMTTVKGTLNVDQAVTLDDTFTVATGKLSQLGGSVTVQQSLDTVVANALDIASTTANAVNVSKSGVMTTVKGTLNVDEAVTMDSTLDVTDDVTITSTTSSNLLSNQGALTVMGGVNIRSTQEAITDSNDPNFANVALYCAGSAYIDKTTYIGNSVQKSDLFIQKGDVEIQNGNLSISGDFLTESNGKNFTSYNIYTIKNYSQLDSDTTTTANTWRDIANYTLSPVLRSANSSVYLQFKVNFVCSNEAEQTISFRILNSDTNNLIFQDLSMGSNMGVTNKGVYNGTYIDTPGTATPNYKLQYLISGSGIDVASGVLGSSHGNYNFLMAQELYTP